MTDPWATDSESPIYDYIVVGAGSAGATLAARLSEDSTITVLLLEAGPDYQTAETPASIRSPNFMHVLQDATYYWPALRARRTPTQEPRRYMRGRGVGGSSAINAQVAIRGMPDDFDRWADLGCTGWSSADVLPFFMKLEEDLNFGDQPYHGRGGPIPVERRPIEQWAALDRALCTAALDLGYPWSDDHNAPDSRGVSPWASNSRNDVRISTNDAYLEPARHRANLTIIGGALVDRVEFEGMRATGVRVRTAAGWTRVAGHTIILCAGAIHSPSILLRSGIGPATDIRALGIPLLVDAPGVGQNLGEHPLITIGINLRPTARAASPHQRPFNCCVRYSSGLDGAGTNDMTIVAGNLSGPDEDGLSIGLIALAAVQAFSRGALHLVTRDPEQDPDVDFRLLSDERDVIRMRDGVRRVFDIVQHPAITAIADGIVVDAMGRGIEDFTTDAQIDAWLMAECGDYFHAVGTCRMGSMSDPRVVVDPDGRVRAIERLRVADASIMPEVPRANTHLTTVMIAEHIAARIQRERTS